MKKNMLVSVVAIALLAVTVVSFIACSQDEAEEDAKQTKIELLKAKAKEFAKKYGVEMSLDEENMEEIAETLTVEQMEKDFQKISSMKMHIVIPSHEEVAMGKRLKIKRTKTVEEEREEDHSGSFEDTQMVYITYAVDSEIFTASYDAQILVWWKYKLKGNNSAGVAIGLDGSPTATASGTLQPSFSSSNRFSFFASGTIVFRILKYKANKTCIVNYEEGGQKSVSIE